MKQNLLITTLLGISTLGVSAANPPASGPASESREQRDQRLAWWKEARFGMFIHWGLYAIPANTWKGLEKKNKPPGLGAEWVMYKARIPVAEYEQLATRFNPVKFDAAEWVEIARDAGMKYVVITAKHCDGFAMYASKVTPYNIVDATPFKRDPIAELKQVCDAKNMRLGYYYSHCWDWHEPDALGLDNTWDFPDRAKKDVNKYFRGKSLPQVEELLTHYDPAVLWFDVPRDITTDQSRWFLDLIRSKRPQCVINSRIGNELGDYGTPEQFIPGKKPEGAFEVCMTTNGHWGYDKNDHEWKTPKTIIHNLVDIASKGGNYLLNVGPTAEGVFPPKAVELLHGVGRWMKVNGESIYGTEASPLALLPWGRCTAKPGRLYLHVFDWPADGKLVLPGLKANIVQAFLLSDSKQASLKVQRISPQDMAIELPAKPLDPIDTVIVLEHEGTLEVNLTPLVLPNTEAVFAASTASLQGSKIAYVPNRLHLPTPYIGSWTEIADRASWEFRVLSPGRYDVVVAYSADAKHEGNEFTVKIGGKTIRAKVGITGDNLESQTFKIGKVDLSGPGAFTLVIRPKALNGRAGLMDFQSLILKPIEAQ